VCIYVLYRLYIYIAIESKIVTDNQIVALL
jgi:hypothetical protein